MHIQSILAFGFLAVSASAAAVSSAAAAAPAATAVANAAAAKSQHHMRFTGYDGPKCNKEHHTKDFKLNVDGSCQKVPKMVYRSFKMTRASRTWTCDVKVYSDGLCKDKIATMPNIDTDENKTCWAWVGAHEGAEVETESMRMSCTDENDDDHDHINAHIGHDDDDDDN